MNWFPVDIAFLDDPKRMIAEDADVGIWLRLVAHCATAENGGVLAGAASWGDREWMRVRVSGQDASRLLDGGVWLKRSRGDVIVQGYPTKNEQRVQKARETGHLGGRKKNRPVSQPVDQAVNRSGQESIELRVIDTNLTSNTSQQGRSDAEKAAETDAKRAREQALACLFEEEFWHLWPEKTHGKARALRSWSKLSKQDRADARSGLERLLQKRNSIAERGGWLPSLAHATTYLNQRRWEGMDAQLDKLEADAFRGRKQTRPEASKAQLKFGLYD